MTRSGTRIIFEATPNAHGWEARTLPWGGLTRILTEHYSWSRRSQIPEIGYRPTVYESQDGSGRSTHYSPGDWRVIEVDHYPAPSEGKLSIAICYCDYSPIERDWKPLNVIPPSPEVVASIEAENPGWTAKYGEKFGLTLSEPEMPATELMKPDEVDEVLRHD